MLMLLWNLSAAIRGYLRFYMPTNRAVDWLRTLRLKWAFPQALIAALIYLCAMRFCAIIVERGGPGYLNVLVLLFAWNSIKFAWIAVVAMFLHLARYVGVVRSPPVAPR